jgi:hypothetical protein
MKRQMIKPLRGLNPALSDALSGGSQHAAGTCWGRPYTGLPACRPADQATAGHNI